MYFSYEIDGEHMTIRRNGVVVANAHVSGNPIRILGDESGSTKAEARIKAESPEEILKLVKEYFKEE